MRLYVAAGSDDPDTWGLFPPTRPDGEPFAAARLIDTADFADEQLIFPIGRSGRRTGLTFFYWQAYAATPAGRDAVARAAPAGVWFSPATTSAGDELFVVRAPPLRGAIDPAGSRLDWHPTYPPRHPLVHLSGQIQLAYKLALRRPVIEGFDLFYLAEYPVVLVITERLLATLQGTGVEGVSGAEFPEIVFAP
ncbi:hypothetical protein J0H58_27815 [bacterium]|nr:hypothetical protein [bacterium]